MPIVSLDQLQDAVDWVSCDFLDNEAFICRQTGRIYWIAGDVGAIDEEDVPEDIHDDDKYLPVPDKRDLDLGNQLAFNFASLYLAEHYDDIRAMFRRPGAYGRFKNFIEQSVLGSMRVARPDLEANLWNFPSVLVMDRVEASRRLTRRPVSVRGKHFWPQDRLLELVARLNSA